MTITARHALVTGGSRGIGRGIALKLAEHGVHVAINYLKDEASAKATLEQVRARGADGFIVQADVCQPEQIERLFDRVRDEFGSLDIFVANARTDVGTFYEPPMAISLDKWDTAMDSQAKAFLVGVREAATLMPDGGRVIAITYAPGRPLRKLAVVGRDGRGQVGARGAGALFRRRARAARHHRQRDQPRLDRGQRAQHAARPVVQMIRDHHGNGWTPMRRLGTPADIGNAVTLFCSKEAGWITGQLIAVDGGAG